MGGILHWDEQEGELFSSCLLDQERCANDEEHHTRKKDSSQGTEYAIRGSKGTLVPEHQEKVHGERQQSGQISRAKE